MISKCYSIESIKELVANDIYWWNPDDLVPSFYTALEKGYVGKYIFIKRKPGITCETLTNEKVMSIINNLLELMISKGYSDVVIKKSICEIQWSEVTDDLAPSFYTAIEKGYIGKYINPYDCEDYGTDEKAISNVNNLIEYMISKGCSSSSIRWFFYYISVKNKHIEDFAPSFYTVLNKGYIEDYYERFNYVSQYFANETVMSNLNNLFELMISNGYSKYYIKKITRTIELSRITKDFAPSFYTAIEKGYIKEYIDMSDWDKHATNETTMSKMNELIKYMIAKKYSAHDIKVRLKYFSILFEKNPKTSNLSAAKLLDMVEKEIPIAKKYETLNSIKNWHDNNIYHDQGNGYLGNTAMEMCAFSLYVGPLFLIVTPVVLVGFIVTEIFYLPIGLLGGYKD